VSQPMPGPMRPPTENPKFNVLLWYAMGAAVIAFSVATLATGGWRLLAVLPGVACAALLVAAFRAGVEAAKDAK
jgi:hypothetical protein